MKFASSIILNNLRKAGFICSKLISVPILHQKEFNEKSALIDRAYHSADNSKLKFKTDEAGNHRR